MPDSEQLVSLVCAVVILVALVGVLWELRPGCGWGDGGDDE